MTREEYQLLHCLRAYRLGQDRAERTESLSPEEWRRLYSLATVHNLVPIVYEMMHSNPRFCNEDSALIGLWKREAILQAMSQTVRTQKLLELTHALDDAGICYAVVKGVVCRQMYYKPDLRLSGDEDLFIPVEERKRCSKIFLQHGLILSQNEEEEGVTHWIDQKTNLHIELHTRLFSLGWEVEETLNHYFESHLKDTIAVPVEQGSVCTLNHTAHLLFLVAHALKHFITGGFGIRTLADILTFCEHYQAQVDCSELKSMLAQVHGTLFFQTLLSIGEKVMAFDIAPWGDISSGETDGQDLLEDMLAAGVYGQTSLNRKHGGAYALQAVQKEGRAPSLVTSLFPPASKLKARYPILNKAPILLPILWLHRIACYAWEVLRSRGEGSSPRETVSLGKQRMEMMVKYGVLPQAKTEDC